MTTHRNHQQLRRLESPQRDDDLLARMNLIDPSRRMIDELDPRRARRLAILIEQQPPNGRVVKNIKVVPVLGLLEVAIVAGAAQQICVERGRALLDARAVARVVVVDDGDAEGLGGRVHEADGRLGDVALVRDLQGAVAVGGGVVGLVGVVEALGLVLLVVVRALGASVSGLGCFLRGSHFDEEGPEVTPAPAWVAEFGPAVVDGRGAAAVVEAVDHAAATETFAAYFRTLTRGQGSGCVLRTGISENTVVQTRLRRRVEAPVNGRIPEELVPAERPVRRDDAGVGPGLEDEDPELARLGEAVGDDEAGGAAAGDDEVVLVLDLGAVEALDGGGERFPDAGEGQEAGEQGGGRPEHVGGTWDEAASSTTGARYQGRARRRSRSGYSNEGEQWGPTPSQKSRLCTWQLLL